MSHYFDKQQTSTEERISFSCTLRGAELTFVSSPGMFSVGKLDRGTEVLVTYADVKKGMRVLDLGCAYGVVGIALAKTVACDVVMVDTNKRAMKYVKENVAANRVDALCSWHVGDGFTTLTDTQFDSILFNPPQHAGKELCNRLIVESKAHLSTGGTLHVVCRHNKGGAGFEKLMQETFGNVQTLCRKSGYRVYLSKNE